MRGLLPYLDTVYVWSDIPIGEEGSTDVEQCMRPTRRLHAGYTLAGYPALAKSTT